MPKAPLLDDAAIAASLVAVDGWTRLGDRLVKKLVFADFDAALAFVNRIAPLANEQNHHPDVQIHWNEVTLELWTHASGGLTERDFRLARAIDEVS